MDVSEINSSCSSCRWLWGELQRLRTTVERIHKQVAELQQQNTKLQQQNTKLQAEIDRLKKEREEAEKNSKRQTSRFPRRQRKTEPKKPGRKKGTPATHRDRPAKVDREIDVPVGNCPDCCCAVENIEVHQQFQTDLPPLRR